MFLPYFKRFVFLAILTVCAQSLSIGLGAVENKPTLTSYWSIVETVYPTDDLVVAAIVMDSTRLPKNPAEEDCSPAFQRAIREVHELGGGHIFVPAGEYLCRQPLRFKRNVHLRGDFKSPNDSDKKVGGTMLKVLYDGLTTNGDNGFIQLDDRSGLRDLTIWYPKQGLDKVIPYAPTIAAVLNKQGKPTPIDEIVIRDVNLLNSYIGFAPQGSARRVDLSGLYGSPLHIGMYQKSSSDVPLYCNISFSPDYWSESGLPGSPSKERLAEYLFSHATGYKIASSDNIFAAEWHVSGYKTGFHFVDEGSGTINGNLYGFHAKQCDVALLVDGVGPTFLVNSSFEGRSGAAIVKDLGSVGLFFNGCTFTSSSSEYSFATQVVKNQKRQLSFQHCIFNKKVSAGSSDFSAMASTFLYDSGPVIELDNKSGPVILLGNRYGYGKQVVARAKRYADKVLRDDTDIQSKRYRHFAINDYRKDRKPTGDNLLVVGGAGYEVHANGKDDDSRVIQKAIDSISAQGGGIVFLPQISEKGYALRYPITVHPGVELRGGSEGLHSFNGGEGVPGALLQIYHGRGSKNPSITLQEGSGLKGLTIHYPEQFMTTMQPYAFTVYMNGDRSYVQNTQFLNAYAAISVYQSDDFLLENIMTTHIAENIRVVESDGGRIQHVNCRDEWDDSKFATMDDMHLFMEESLKNSVPYTIIDSEQIQLFATFARMSNWLGYFENSSIHALCFSMESCHNGFRINGVPKGQSLEFIGSSLRVNNDVEQPVTYLQTAAKPDDGDIRFFSSLATGYPDTILQSDGADLTFQQCMLPGSPRKIATNGLSLEGGAQVRLENCLMDYFVTTPVVEKGGDRLELFGNYFNNGIEALFSSTKRDSSPLELKDVGNLSRPVVSAQLNLESPGSAGLRLLTTQITRERRNAYFRQWYETLSGYVSSNDKRELRFEVDATLSEALQASEGAILEFFYYDDQPGEMTVSVKAASKG